MAALWTTCSPRRAGSTFRARWRRSPTSPRDSTRCTPGAWFTDGPALLTDFGLARGPAHTVLTRPGQLIGTPHYLAPEVITGGSAEPVSDVYALGCVAYACLVGEPPFPRNNVFEVTIAHLEDEPPDPATLGIELGASVSIALRTALAKTPSERPASARAYALALWRAAAPSGRT
ncbi:MAG: protein kinase [Gaiellales bacterium]